jgi:hypothetical protein
MTNNICLRIMIFTALSISDFAVAQKACSGGRSIEGSVTDPTGSMISGATIRALSGEEAITDQRGHYMLPCVPAAVVEFTASAQGFATAPLRLTVLPGQPAHADFTLRLENVETQIEVSDEPAGLDSDRGAGSVTFSTEKVQQLADDPDDLLRQLQTLSASAGGSPGSAVVMVDGFRNGSTLPPKSSIASIRVNPDLFSAEYRFPPFEGGLIEVVTKPGAERFHGALFDVESNRSFNATAPLSTVPSPSSRRRYGFEWSGSIFPQRSSFAVALEKRDIGDAKVVKATALDSSGAATAVHETVSTPQHLWIGSARGDWQMTPKDISVLSFSSRLNRQDNQGVGGLTLAEAGYDSTISEHSLRFTNTLMAGANRLYETRAGYTWRHSEQTAFSSAPSVQVAGYFTGGGASGQNRNDREHDFEMDEDVLFTGGKQELKAGIQSLGMFVRSHDPDNFNGTYLFGGGAAPVLSGNSQPTTQTTTIDALEQYRRAQRGLAGGMPTTYQLTRGTALVPLTQWQVGLYVQDAIKLAPRFTVNTGFRYALQTSPRSAANFGPRAGFSWAANRKQTWIFRARIGLFSGLIGQRYGIEARRLNGVLQQKVTVYSPNYVNPLTLNAGSTVVSTTQRFPRSFAQSSIFAGYFNVEHELPGHWNVRMNVYFESGWDVMRTRNINAPLVAGDIGVAADPVAALLAPRPLALNENILEYQNAGHVSGRVVSFVVDQHRYKRFGIFSYYAYRIARSDGGNGDVMPQSSYSDAGEPAQADWARSNSVFLTANLNLPGRVTVATQFDAQGGLPFNITTGTDNNGDGDFNDRPSYTSVPGAGVYATRYGLLTANTVNGNVPRNLGRMPAVVHMDMDVSRVFALNPKDKDHPRTLTLHVRSANFLNHTNVTTVGTVLSPNLGQPLSAEEPRRVEVGARVAF